MPHPTTRTAYTPRPRQTHTPAPARPDPLDPPTPAPAARTQARPGQPAQPAPAAKPIDPKKIAARTTALHKAMSGWGTDEEGVLNALRDLSPEEMKAVRSEYADHYRGASLDAAIKSEMGGADLKEAQQYLSGDRVGGAIQRLQNSVGLINDDEAAIEETLTGLSKEELKDLQGRMAGNPRVKRQIDGVLSHLGGEDREVADALLAGDKGTAAAVRLDEAMDGWGTDEEAVNRYLKQAGSDEERKAIADAYAARLKARGERGDLKGSLQAELSGTDEDISVALLKGDSAELTAARLEEAARGMGTDEQAIFDQLKGLDKDQRAKLEDAYQRKYGRSLADMLGSEMGGDHLARAEMLRETGKVEDAFALRTAMKGMGTDESALRTVLEGKTAAEIQALEADYKKKYGRSLQADLNSELSGRDHFEVADQAMKGRAETAEQARARANERYAYERSGAFSNAVMDAGEFIGLHENGSQLDYQTDRINGMFDAQGQLRAGQTTARALQVGDWQKADTSAYVESKNAATDAMATGAEIAVAAGATYLTGGAASPWLAAAIAGGSGLAGMGTRYAMQGDAYGWEDAALDLGRTGVNAATAGLMSTGGADRMFSGMAERSAGQLGRISPHLGGEGAQAFLGAGYRGAAQSMAGQVYTSGTNDQRWRMGAEHYFGGMAGDVALSGGTSFLSGGAGGLAESRFQTTETYRQLMTQKMAGGLASGTVGTALDAQTWSGRPEDVLGRFGSSALMSTGQGALDGALERRTRSNVAFKKLLAGGSEGEMSKIGQDVAGFSGGEQDALRQRLFIHTLENSDLGSLSSPRIEDPPAIVRPYEEEVPR